MSGNRQAPVVTSRLQALVIEHLMSHPMDQINIKDLARQIGVSYHTVYRRFSSREALYENTVRGLLATSRRLVTAEPIATMPPVATLREIVRRLVLSMDSDVHAKLLQIVLRDHRRFAWLTEAYETDYLEHITLWAQTLLSDAGSAMGVIVVPRRGSVRDLVDDLEGQIALRRLRPWIERQSPDLERLTAASVAKLFSQVEFHGHGAVASTTVQRLTA